MKLFKKYWEQAIGRSFGFKKNAMVRFAVWVGSGGALEGVVCQGACALLAES